MLKKPIETQTSKSRPSSRTPARPTHIRTNSQSGPNQVSGSRRRKDTGEDPSAHHASDSTQPPAIPPRTCQASAARAKAPEHSFLTDVADVREMEKGLLSLLDDFHSGKLQAFGSDDAFMKMDEVREQQEQLARMHFNLDQDVISDNPDGAGVGNLTGSKASSSGVSEENMDSLLTRLHSLSQAIQDLHPEASVSQSATPSAMNTNNADLNNDADGS